MNEQKARVLNNLGDMFFKAKILQIGKETMFIKTTSPNMKIKIKTVP